MSLNSNGGKTLTIYNVDRLLWQQLRHVALTKGSPAAYCVNSAMRDYLVKQGSVRA